MAYSEFTAVNYLGRFTKRLGKHRIETSPNRRRTCAASFVCRASRRRLSPSKSSRDGVPDCESAGGPYADTHDNALLFLTLTGSFLYAYHTTSFASVVQRATNAMCNRPIGTACHTSP